MNRALIAGLSFTLLILLGACSAKTPVPPLPPGELPVVASENFAGMTVGAPPTKWRIVNRGDTTDTPYVTDAPARSEDRSLLFDRKPTNSHIANGVALDFKALNREAVASFWFYATDPGRTLVITMSSDTNAGNPFGSSTGPFLVLRDTKLQAYSEDKFQDAGSFSEDTWHKVTIEVDIRNRTYSVFLDDAEEPAHDAPFHFRSDANNNVAALGLGYQAANQSGSHEPVYVDDIEIRGQ